MKKGKREKEVKGIDLSGIPEEKLKKALELLEKDKKRKMKALKRRVEKDLLIRKARLQGITVSEEEIQEEMKKRLSDQK